MHAKSRVGGLHIYMYVMYNSRLYHYYATFLSFLLRLRFVISTYITSLPHHTFNTNFLVKDIRFLEKKRTGLQTERITELARFLVNEDFVTKMLPWLHVDAVLASSLAIFSYCSEPPPSPSLQ